MATDGGSDEVIVTCCHCGAQFDERLLEGPFLDRRCPRCKKRLGEDDYDALALRLLDAARELAEQANEMYPRIKELEEVGALFNRRIVLINDEMARIRAGAGRDEADPIAGILPDKSGTVLLLPVRSQVKTVASRIGNPQGNAMLRAFKSALSDARQLHDDAPMEFPSELLDSDAAVELEDEDAADPPLFDGNLSDPDDGPRGPKPPCGQPPSGDGPAPAGPHAETDAGSGQPAVRHPDDAVRIPEEGESPAEGDREAGDRDDRPPAPEYPPARARGGPLSSSVAAQISLEALEALTAISREAEEGRAHDARSDRDFERSEDRRKHEHYRKSARIEREQRDDEARRQELRDEQRRLARLQYESERDARRSQEKLRERLMREREAERAREQLEYDREHPKEAQLRNALEDERKRNREKEDKQRKRIEYLERELKRQRTAFDDYARKAKAKRQSQQRQHEYELGAAKRRADHETRALKRQCNREVDLVRKRARAERNAIRLQAEADKASIREAARSHIEQASRSYRETLDGLGRKLDAALESAEAAFESRASELQGELDAERGRRLLLEGPGQGGSGTIDALLRRRALMEDEAKAVKEEAAASKARIEYLNARERDVRDKVAALARDRYYVGEWFRLTRSPLEDRDTYGNEYSFVPYYNADSGRFALSTNDRRATSILRGWGQYGEFSVFEWLRREAGDPRSPLGGARVLPDLVFSWQDGAGPSTTWAQVDCLVLTRRLAAFIEVKHWSCSIEVRAPFVDIRVREDGDGCHEPLGAACARFGQARRASAALKPITDRYPDRCVLDMTVFVDPAGFDTDSDRFAGTSFVGWCSPVGQNFVDALRAKESSLRPLMEHDELAALADEIFEHANDQGNRRSGARRQWAAGQLDRFFSEQRHDPRFGWVERGGEG